mmetsp:Transcript_56949/g.94669  ORF Transcript_56949/g.94669 Transcript_56949/m.94669 type:complete len:235 (+) Transcript_56949:40-744(+)
MADVESTDTQSSGIEKHDPQHDTRSVYHIRNEYLCFGYIRDIESMLLNQVIPIDIIQLCSQYHFSYELFLVAHHAYSIQDDGRTVEKISTEYNTAAFGAAKLPSNAHGIYEWTFKILHRETSMYIGITTNLDQPKADLWKGVDGMSCSVSTTGTKVVNKDRSSAYGPSAMFQEDGLIRMQLDLIDMKLTYFRNGESLGVLNNNLPSGDDMFYQMCVTFLNARSKITLEEFRQLR